MLARLAPERLQPGLGNSGCATVRRGVFGSCPGAFREVFGTFRGDLWAPLSVRCPLQLGLGIHSDLGIPGLEWYRRSSFLVNE